MKLIQLFVLVTAFILIGCLKKVDPGFGDNNNIFDPQNEPQMWFTQESIDSVHIGGIVYRYVLTYRITHPQLLSGAYDYRIGVKRNDSDIYGSTAKFGDKFQMNMFNKHRVGGVFCHSLGISGENSAIITSPFQDCFEE